MCKMCMNQYCVRNSNTFQYIRAYVIVLYWTYIHANNMAKLYTNIYKYNNQIY